MKAATIDQAAYLDATTAGWRPIHLLTVYDSDGATVLARWTDWPANLVVGGNTYYAGGNGTTYPIPKYKGGESVAGFEIGHEEYELLCHQGALFRGVFLPLAATQRGFEQCTLEVKRLLDPTNLCDFWPYVVTAASNDRLSVALAGGSAVTATVAPGTYSSASSLAAALQTALTAAVANAWSVTVSDGHFVIAGAAAFTLSGTAPTNRLIRSQEFDDSAWGKSSGPDMVVTPNTTAAPDGTTTADTLTAASGYTYVVSDSLLAGLGAVGETWTYSVWLKGDPARTARLSLFTYDGTLEAVNEYFPLSATWTRRSVTLTIANPGHTGLGVYVISNPDAQAFQAWGAQVNPGSAPGQYVATGATAVPGGPLGSLFSDLGFSEMAVDVTYVMSSLRLVNGRGTIQWFKGRIGPIEKVTSSVVNIRAESGIADLTMMLPRIVFAPTCSNTLGDINCGVTLASFTVAGTASAGGTTTSFGTSLTQADSYFQLGVITFDAGTATVALRGLKRAVKTYVQASGVVTLDRPLPVAPAAGDAFSVVAGCDKTYDGSQGCPKFYPTTAAAHFRGFPFVPKNEAAF